jgi:LCP family protein required for cell wall assembly
MSGIQRTAIGLLSIAACALLALVGYAGLKTYDQWFGRPLGAPLPTSPYTPIDLPATWTPVFRTAAPNATLSPTPTQTPLCGGPPVMSILLIGSDTRSTGYTWGLSDVMRIARVDFTTPRLAVLDFPRDLWVKIPEIADNLNGQDHEKLNQAYLYGNPGDGFKYWDDPSAGPGLLARTLDLNFGAKIDHYLAINMQTFVRMVDAVGGIDVTLDQRIGGSHDPNLQEGLHHLDGAEALAVARNRAEGVFSRGEEQNLVLCALQKRLTNPAVLTHIPQLISSFQGSVQTDLSPQIMSQLACLSAKMPRGSIALYSFPQELFTGERIHDPVFPEQKEGVFVWDADFLVLRNYVAEFQAGMWPDSEGSPRIAQSVSFCK